MMKLLIFTLVFVALATTSAVHAQTATPSGENAQKIEDLKDRLATKVAELRQTQRRVIVGTVKTVTITTLTVETPTSDVKIELTDDIVVAQIVGGKRTQLDAEDLEKDDRVVVFGDFDTTLEILNAKFVYIQAPLPVRAAGAIKEISKADFTITITGNDGLEYIIDFERNTVANLWSDEKRTKIAFSAFAVGETIHVTGTPNEDEDQRIHATRILNLGSLVIPSATPEPSPSPTPKTSPTPIPEE